MRETVEKACAIARYTAEDPYAGLVEPEALARDIPDLDLDHPWALTPEQAIELARRCEAAGLRGGLAHHQFRRRLGQQPAPHRRVRQLAWFSRRRSPAPATPSAARSSRSRARRCSATTGTPPRVTPADSKRRSHRPHRRRARGGATGLAQAVDAQGAGRCSRRKWRAACSGISSARSAARASTARRRSCWMRPGKQVFPDFPADARASAHPQGARQRPFDDEGAATHDRDLVRDGVLKVTCSAAIRRASSA